MEVVQSSFFDVGTYDEAKAYAYRRQQDQKELDEWLIGIIGTDAFKRRREADAKLTAELNAICSRKRTPEFQATIDAMHTRLDAKWAEQRKSLLATERALLGISPDASKRVVKNAYRRAARKLHPDVGGSEEAFRQLHEAYRRVLAAAKA